MPRPAPGAAFPPLPGPARALERLLQGTLPGRSAQRAAWPDHLPGRADPLEAESFGPAAVLLALLDTRDGPAFPLIRRPQGLRRHAGQISLPGGELEAGEDLVGCALREAEEEIGLRGSHVGVLGLLTPVYVPVTRYRIQPVVGWISGSPSWSAQAAEVEEILMAEPDRLLREGPRGRVRRERGGQVLEAPAYVVPSLAQGEALVWGATAIILAEFLALWAKVREAYPPET